LQIKIPSNKLTSAVGRRFENSIDMDNILKLELLLHTPEVRSDKNQLNSLLHDLYLEIGRSGKTYCKKDIVEKLPVEHLTLKIWAQEFSISEIGQDVVLVAYKSANIVASGDMENYSKRSSLWVRNGKHWQMRYHQGTPTDAFELDDT